MCQVEWKQCIQTPNEWAVKLQADIKDPDNESLKPLKDAKI